MPYIRGNVTVIPVFRSRTTVFPGGGAGDKEPVGLLIHSGTSLRIVSFTISFAWWDELAGAYPDLQSLHPVFPERSPERPQK
ncbi:hypothetical protein MKMG_00520 [Methanogenium sp. MK-MG]|nr:hypothetical protein MKMG_00520 [Methanogenium sp. MK-MG]